MSTHSDAVFDGLISEPGFGFIDRSSPSHGVFHSLKALNALDLFSSWNMTICHFALLDFSDVCAFFFFFFFFFVFFYFFNFFFFLFFFPFGLCN